MTARFSDGDVDARATALAALEVLLALLHPVMPHVTEEIWSNLPARETRLIVAPWPGEVAPTDEAGALTRVQEAAERFRRAAVRTTLEGEEARIFETVVRPERMKANGNAEAEIARLRKELELADSKLANESFVAKAPPHVVEEWREKRARFQRELDDISR